jgi:hypothetical protein
MGIHLERILWPTDQSQLALKGLEYARVLCDTFKSQLFVLHVAPTIVLNSTMVRMTAGDASTGVIDTVTPAKRWLRDLVNAQFGSTAGGVRVDVVVGSPWYEICRYVQQHRID